jgi:menaquinone-dependent protoporphyrinogen oxidase
MPPHVLVAYATLRGTTRGVAETIGTAMRNAGMQVDVRRASGVNDCTGYAAVVLGTPLYAGKVLKEARLFPFTHRKALKEIPFYVFLVGMSLGRPGRGQVRKANDALIPMKEQVEVREVGYFGGALGLLDLRDPAKIEGWAIDIARVIRQERALISKPNG